MAVYLSKMAATMVGTSVSISSYSGILVPRLLSHICNHLIFIAIINGLSAAEPEYEY